MGCWRRSSHTHILCLTAHLWLPSTNVLSTIRSTRSTVVSWLLQEAFKCFRIGSLREEADKLQQLVKITHKLWRRGLHTPRFMCFVLYFTNAPKSQKELRGRENGRGRVDDREKKSAVGGFCCPPLLHKRVQENSVCCRRHSSLRRGIPILKE